MKKINVAIAGLGRLGKVHAKNLAFRIPGASLVAACSVVNSELDFAKNELGVENLYSDFQDMIKQPGLDAVAIVTPSSLHCEQIGQAFDAGLHVFVEKPLGINVEECKEAEKLVESNQDKVFFLAFMRRYDPNYVYAKEKIKEGKIGKPYMVKAIGIDPEAGVKEAIRFSPTSGGLFIDMASHDIDLMRWFLEDEPEKVFALGGSYKYKEFSELGDIETGCAMYKFKNGGMGTLHVGRSARHGYHIETEIIGTEGSIRISPIPAKNQAVVYDKQGVVMECFENFQERFELAYRAEMEEFINCILQDKKPDISVYDGTRATAITFATTKALKTGEIVDI